LFWTPFDVRFSGLLERLKSHQVLFHNEIQLEESKALEIQYEKRENDARMTTSAFEQIKEQMRDLRISVDEMEVKLTEKVVELMAERRAIEADQSQMKTGAEQELQAMSMCVSP
jgi:hypothetical protein